MSKIGILCIATGNYKSLVQKMIDGVEKYFLVNHEREIYLFTDEEREYKSELKIIQTIIPGYKWPDATMLRYQIFTSKTYECDYLVYSDIDMGFVAPIGDEFLGDIIAVRHPGFFTQPCNSWEKNKDSKCYIPIYNRIKYFCGGIQGGRTHVYYIAMELMKCWIKSDNENGIIPIYHDETAWNAFLSMCNLFKEHDCSYCMPEAMFKRKRWGIENIEPKILALEKDFKYMRS